MDALGTILFIGAVCCLLLVLTWGGEKYPWNDQRCVGLLVGFGLLTVAFCFWLWKQGEVAIIPLRVLRQRSIYMGALVLFGLGMSNQTYSYYLPIFFQSAQGVSTTESGIRFIALVVPQIVSLVIVGAIVTKWGYFVSFSVLPRYSPFSNYRFANLSRVWSRSRSSSLALSLPALVLAS
jgi:hypothetical protein